MTPIQYTTVVNIAIRLNPTYTHENLSSCRRTTILRNFCIWLALRLNIPRDLTGC